MRGVIERLRMLWLALCVSATAGLTGGALLGTGPHAAELPLPTCAVLISRAPNGAEPRVSLTSADLSLRHAIESLLEGSGLTLASDEPLLEPIAGRYDSLTVGSALDVLVRGNGYAWSIEDGVFRVTRSETRTYFVDQVAPPDSPYWKDLADNLPKLLSSDARIAVNPRAGLVTVTDTPAAQARARQFFAGVGGKLERQVHIEAQILERKLQETEETGVDWRALAYGWDGIQGGTDHRALIEQMTTTGNGVFQMGLIRTDRLSALLELLEERGDLEVLSRPAVVALGNEPAHFSVTEHVPYYELTTFANSGDTPYTQYTVHFEEAGVRLDVLGQVGADGRVTLLAHPMVSAVTGYTPSLPGLPPQPIIDERETETTVRLREGETLVIGGLIQSRKQLSTRGVPVLGRIPYLGRFFRNQVESEGKYELTIVLTPTVLGDRSADRLQQAGRALYWDQDWPVDDARSSLAALLHDRALDSWHAGALDDAIAASELALVADPRRDLERLNLGYFLAANGNFAGARDEFLRLAKVPQARGEARANLLALSLAEGSAARDTLAIESTLGSLAARAAWAVNEATRLAEVGAQDRATALLRRTSHELPDGPERGMVLDCLAELGERAAKD